MTETSTILLVEDDSSDIKLIRRAFEKAKIANPFRVVRNGDDAVAYLSGDGEFSDRATHPLPALTLLDLKLPRRSGLEVLEWIRTRPGLRRLPVVILTSSRHSEDINRAYDLGANSYLVKPVQMDDLIDMVKTLEVYWVLLNEKPDPAAHD